MDCITTRARTREEFKTALCKGGADIIITGYRLPHYDGISALKLALERCADIPLEGNESLLDVLPECHHLCLIYDNEEQRRKIVSEYLAAGLKRGALVRYFADKTTPEEVRT